MLNHLPKHECPCCHKEMDAATGPAIPKKGDVTVCLYCVGINIVTGDEKVLRKPTDEELAELMGDPHLRTILRSIQFGIKMAKAGRN